MGVQRGRHPNHLPSRAPDLKYSDGSPLTAENFRYAVERTCDPVTAGEYQSILFEIVGCAEFAGLSANEEGEAREYTPEEYEEARSALGAKALDDRTLQIDLTNPAPYYHTIAYTWVFYPVKKEIVDADPDNWWKTAENHIGNGPFRVTESTKTSDGRSRPTKTTGRAARNSTVSSTSTSRMPRLLSRPIAPAISTSLE